MDYKTYLDFVLALENRQEPQSLHYLFKILDVNNQGYLDTFCLNYFFRVSADKTCFSFEHDCTDVIIVDWQAIQEQLKMHNQTPVNFKDVKDEIFDMVKPQDPMRITLQDLLNW